MSAARQDYILRLIEELGAAVRRMRELLARGVPAAEVVQSAEEAQAELFGPMWPTLRSVDPATAVALLSDPRQILLWAELLQVKAEAHRRMGEAARANALEAQAAGLLREAFPRT